MLSTPFMLELQLVLGDCLGPLGGRCFDRSVLAAGLGRSGGCKCRLGMYCVQHRTFSKCTSTSPIGYRNSHTPITEA